MNQLFFHVKLLGKRMLLLVLIMGLCRLSFLFFNFHVFMENPLGDVISTFFYGLLFDFSAITYANSLFILLHIIPANFRLKKWYQSLLKWLFVLVNSVVVLFNLADTGYFPFLGKRMGVEILGQAEDVGRMSGSYLLDYWYLLVTALFIIGFMIRFYPKFPRGFDRLSMTKIQFKFKRFFAETGLFLLVSSIGFIAIRGGFYLRPIRSIDAARFVSPNLIPLTLNNPFNFFSTLQNPTVEEVHFMPMDLAYQLANPIKKYAPLKQSLPMNVVIIILESFGKEYIGHFNNGKGYTPFLDSLLDAGFSCENAYANGRRSIDAIPAILSSILTLIETPYLNTPYQDNRISSLGDILMKDMGYSAGFYHGATNGTMGFDNYISISQCGVYSGLNEYPKKQEGGDGGWGIYDEPYLQFFCNELSKKEKPFCQTVFTISSHHPYHIPEKYKGKFPKGTLPIHESIGYADYALRQFFEEAKKKSWYKNTLFVITGDHSSISESETYSTSEGKYKIPLLFYREGDSTFCKKKFLPTVQHLDIMPSVLQIVGYKKPFFSLGTSIFEPRELRFAIQATDGFVQYIIYPKLVQFDGNATVGYFNLTDDPLMKNNHKQTGKQLATELVGNLKAFIQVYNHVLITNRMLP